MNVNEAIIATVQHFKDLGNFTPSHCDVRCMINDLTQDNARIVEYGYSQDRAFKRVRSALATLRKYETTD